MSTSEPDHDDRRMLTDFIERFVNELSDDQITKLREHWARQMTFLQNMTASCWRQGVPF